MELAGHYLDAYAEVLPNLARHAKGWPAVEHLRSVTVAGHDGTDDGVNLLLRALKKDDPRPVWYGNWGSNSGTTSNLKRALDRLRGEGKAAYAAALAKLRVVSLDGNVRARHGPHAERFPLYVETGWPEKYGTGYGTRWYHQFMPITGAKKEDVAEGHGPLGAFWTGPKEGDTWCFLYLVPNGLSDPERPRWGGWAGRYGVRPGSGQGVLHVWNDEEDAWPGTRWGSPQRNNTVARYGDAVANDFKARLDWCVTGKYEEANHPPTVVLNGDATRRALSIPAGVGETVGLSAEGSSDPDGGALSYRWVFYPEAGTAGAEVRLTADGPLAEVTLPAHFTPGQEVHVYVEVTDDGDPPLTRYRRAVIRAR
jgi:hypothetical protein